MEFTIKELLLGQTAVIVGGLKWWCGRITKSVDELLKQRMICIQMFASKEFVDEALHRIWKKIDDIVQRLSKQEATIEALEKLEARIEALEKNGSCRKGDD